MILPAAFAPFTDTARAAGFAVGLWLGRTATEWLSPNRALAMAGCLAGLAADQSSPSSGGNALAQIGSGMEPWLFTVGLGLAVGLIVLVRASTNSDTRTVELAEQAARSATARDHLELIVDHAPEAIIGLDAGGNVRWLNRTAAVWLGDRADSAVGRRGLASQCQSAPFRAPSSTTPGSWLGRPTRVARSTRACWKAPPAPERVLASYSAEVDATNDEVGLLLLRDASVVTESLREQEELAVHLSHELRAPLTTILGYAQ